MFSDIKIPKKLAMINDIAGYGRCSTTVALPIISKLKVQACPVPTSIFSNHTGFSTYHFTDYTPHMQEYLDAWEQLDLDFDGIYVGFLGSVHQIQIVRSFIKKHPKAIIIVDPVMGDHGKAYKTITVEHCQNMKLLLERATIITPNITEACLLTDTPYKEKWTEDELLSISKKLHLLGPQKVVITGIEENNCFLNYVSQFENNYTHQPYRFPVSGESRHGTGDMFASIISADTLNEVNFCDSVKKAAEFIRICIEASSLAKVPESEGVIFENYLDLLH